MSWGFRLLFDHTVSDFHHLPLWRPKTPEWWQVLPRHPEGCGFLKKLSLLSRCRYIRYFRDIRGGFGVCITDVAGVQPFFSIFAKADLVSKKKLMPHLLLSDIQLSGPCHQSMFRVPTGEAIYGLRERL